MSSELLNIKKALLLLQSIKCQKIIVLLTTEKRTIKELSKLAGISKASVSVIIEKLQKTKIVKRDRRKIFGVFNYSLAKQNAGIVNAIYDNARVICRTKKSLENYLTKSRRGTN